MDGLKCGADGSKANYFGSDPLSNVVTSFQKRSALFFEFSGYPL